ncbi:MAG: hypothetical protein EON98_07200 [Chitinophagaceae bacterium]|nr:MAG: hypothetical protein EON98_07200 [Chitinophagaceae bacterium]
MKTYPLYFRFRSQEIKAHVHDFGDSCTVFFTDDVIINDFTGSLTFENKKYAPGFIRNKEAKDLQELIRLIENSLQ